MSNWRILSDLMHGGERFEKMAKRWYAERGKPYPGDPAQVIVDRVRENGGVADKNVGLLVLTPEIARKLTEKGGGSI